jgi:hypothetical protein
MVPIFSGSSSLKKEFLDCLFLQIRTLFLFQSVHCLPINMMYHPRRHESSRLFQPEVNHWGGTKFPKVQGIKRVTWSKFHSEGSKILDVTIQNLITPTLHLEFVCPCDLPLHHNNVAHLKWVEHKIFPYIAVADHWTEFKVSTSLSAPVMYVITAWNVDSLGMV